jgi:uncharacterized protein YuzE
MTVCVVAILTKVRYDVEKLEEVGRGEESVMKLHFDEKAQAIYLRLDDTKIIDAEEVRPGVVLDFNEHNHVVGIELLDLKDRVPRVDLLERLLGEGEQ